MLSVGQDFCRVLLTDFAPMYFSAISACQQPRGASLLHACTSPPVVHRSCSFLGAGLLGAGWGGGSLLSWTAPVCLVSWMGLSQHCPLLSVVRHPPQAPVGMVQGHWPKMVLCPSSRGRGFCSDYLPSKNLCVLANHVLSFPLRQADFTCLLPQRRGSGPAPPPAT